MGQIDTITAETASSVSPEPWDQKLVDYTEPWYTAFVCLYILLTGVVIFGSVLIMRAYWTTPHLQTTSNLLIFNMSLMDCTVITLTVPWVLINYTKAGLLFSIRSKWACLLSLFISTATGTGSMMAVLLISLERFIAVVSPFAFYYVVNDRSVKVANLVAWIVPAGLHIMPLFGWNTWQEGLTCVTMNVYDPIYNSFISSGSRAIILLTAALMNIVICIVAFKKKRSSVGDVNSRAEEGAVQDFKLTKMMLTVVGVFYLCWAPFVGLTVYYTMMRGQVSVWLVAAQDFSILGAGINSALNPLIYSRSNKKFRAAFKKILSISQTGAVNDAQQNSSADATNLNS